MRKPSPEFDAFLDEIAKKECCTIQVRADSTVNECIRDYKIYINRNIRVTPPRRQSNRSEGVEIIPVESGDYLVVVREKDVGKVNRLESNSITLSISGKETINLKLSINNGSLKLSYENS
jgi:hypothetical protein